MTPGPLMVIGGAEDKTGPRTVLSRFVRLAGGADARIAVIATASVARRGDRRRLPDRVRQARGRPTSSRPGPRTGPRQLTRTLVAQLADVTGVFMTGGNQSTLAGVVAGTPFGAAIRAAHERGAVVAGTSAGASVQSEHMIAFGSGGTTPKLRMAQMSAGLGLLPGVVVDQHFDQRNRYGRLLTLVAHAPHLLGMGIDEDTAAVVSDGHLEVVGRGAVTLFDGRAVTSNVDTASGTAPLLVSGVVAALPARRIALRPGTARLPPGAGGRTDDLRDREPVPPPHGRSTAHRHRGSASATFPAAPHDEQAEAT